MYTAILATRQPVCRLQDREGKERRELEVGNGEGELCGSLLHDNLPGRFSVLRPLHLVNPHSRSAEKTTHRTGVRSTRWI